MNKGFIYGTLKFHYTSPNNYFPSGSYKFRGNMRINIIDGIFHIDCKHYWWSEHKSFIFSGMYSIRFGVKVEEFIPQCECTNRSHALFEAGPDNRLPCGYCGGQEN